MYYSPYQTYQPMPQFQQQPQQPQSPYNTAFGNSQQNVWQKPQTPSYNTNTMPQPMLSGRYVANPKEITANEVPMDGSVGFFPTTDQQYVYAKAWNADGKIETGIYKLVKEETQENESTTLDIISERLDRIEKMLSPKTTTRKKSDAEQET